MEMEGYLMLAVMALCGGILGWLYFWGLLKTMEWVTREKSRVNLVMLASFLGRAGLLMAAFFVLGGSDWRRLVALVLGFLVARGIMVRRLKPPATDRQNRSA